MNDLMIKTILPLEQHPNAQIGDFIKLTKKDVEFTQTMVEHMDLSKLGDLYMVVEYMLGGKLIGAVCQDVKFEIKMGPIDPGDYRVVGAR